MLKHTKKLTAAMLCIVMALCVSCKKDNVEPTTQTVATVTTNEVTEITKTSAVCGGEVVNDNGCAVTGRGVCWGKAEHPTLSDSYTEDGNGVGKFTSKLTGLEPGTTYYVRAYAKNAAGTSFGDEKNFTTGVDAYVDLGLPSGILWATCNVGADSPQDYGDYFAWGETEPKENYWWETYQWCKGSFNTLTKYCDNSGYGNNGFVDYKTILEMSDDAASANWGGDWRMPTAAEWKELYDNTTSTWTTQNGVNGRLFTSTVSGHTSRSLFLPAAGLRADSPLNYYGSDGYYWSSSLDSSFTDSADILNFHSSNVNPQNSCTRYVGISVRPVRPSQK